jgi:hypothetical protein
MRHQDVKNVSMMSDHYFECEHTTNTNITIIIIFNTSNEANFL